MTLKYAFVSKKGLGEEFPLELIETNTFLLQYEESFWCIFMHPWLQQHTELGYLEE